MFEICIWILKIFLLSLKGLYTNKKVTEELPLNKYWYLTDNIEQN